MELIFWWMPLVWLAVVAAVAGGVVLLRRRLRRSREDAPPIPVAHADRLTRLPGYRAALGRFAGLLAATAALVGIAFAGAVGLTMRPASVDVVHPDLNNRDIVLCLDVSGSMIEYDRELIEVFGTLAEQFTGERIGLVVFNASAVTYFPLTTDYDYVIEQLARLDGEFESEDSSYYAGTLIGNGSSLIGDGLASCVLRFDNLDSERSRSVILATDNLLAGDPIFELEDAADLAAERDVRVYGLNPGDTSAKDYLDELAIEFENAVTATGGAYYPLDDPAAVPAIVERISAEQAALLEGPTQLVYDDQPAVPFLVALGGFAGLLLLARRLQR